MTLYDLIMGQGFARSDWTELGRGEILNKDTIKRMLMEGYEAVANEA